MSKTKNLSDLSKAPNVIANKTPEDIEKRIIEARIMYPGWGAKKIKVSLETKGLEKEDFFKMPQQIRAMLQNERDKQNAEKQAEITSEIVE